MFRRLKPENIRDSVHKALYKDSKGNELTKEIIRISNNFKKKPLEKLL